MGMFMASVAFQCADKEKLAEVTHFVRKTVSGVQGLVDNLHTDGPFYGVLNMFGDEGSTLSVLPERISAITGAYAVFAVCIDSDCNLLSLYHDGKLLENSCTGLPYPEFEEINKPSMELWLPLLQDPTKIKELQHALYTFEVFAEDNLRELSVLTGLPILDDNMIGEYVKSYM